jgi:Peptidase family C25/Propeptide_C25/Secretion system C-terminal sorting domain
MRANLYLSVVLLFTGVLLFAANGFDVEYYQPTLDQYELNFNLDDFRLGDTVKNGVTYSTIDFEGGVTTKDAGFAEVPFIHGSLQISADKNVSLEIVSSEYEEFELLYPLLPSRGTIFRNQDPSTIPYEIAEESLVDEFYPTQLAENVDPFIIRDLRGTIVYVYPFQYNAVRNVLRVYTNVAVRLTDNNTPAINQLPRRNAGVTREMNNMYSTLFMNYDVSRFENEIAEFGSILVIHTPRDADAIAPYVEWKQQKGFTVYVEEVATGTNVTTLVQDQYIAHNDILYVQLVGDWEDISGTVMGGDPTDPKLGCVVGTDIYPDIITGRFSAANATDVTTQVDKSINYEKYPDAGEDWYETAVGIASSQGPGDDGEMDNVHITNIYDNKLDPFTYETHVPIYDPSANATMVAAAVNDGASIINYCGHGSSTSWVSSGFNNSQVNMLTNETKLPFIISVACVNGSFDGATCFAEAWLRKSGGGAVGMLASTQNQSWNPPMMGQDYINDLLIGGYDYSLYPGQNGTTTDVQKTTYGSTCFNGTILMAMEDGAQGAEEMAKWHIFGDASLQVRTETPQTATLSNNVILMGVDFGTTITLGSNPAVGALVSLHQNGAIFSGITDDAGSVTIAHGLTAGDAQLIVTGFNINTIFEDIAVVPPGGAYVMFEDCFIEDQSANNNGMLDYGETIDLGVTLVNVGTDDATGVIATISSTDTYVTILDDTENYGDISGGSSAMVSGAFQISVDDLVPDGHGVIFSVDISDGTDTWTSNFSITAHAPVIEMGTFIIDDTVAGNGDFFWDAGETVDIFITVENNGTSDVFSVDAELICNDPNITLNSNQSTYGTIAFGESSEQSFNVASSSNTPQAHLASFTFDITTDVAGLTGSGAFDAQIGGYLIEEYFDNAFPPADWSISGVNPGNWSASTTSNAGGSSPEAEFSWSPSFTGFSALTTPVINTTGAASLSLTYNHFVNDFSGSGYSVGVKTTSDGGTTWNTVYEVFPTGDVGPETLDLTIETPDVGSDTFQIAFFFDGYSYDLDYYFVDSIILGGGASNPGYVEGVVSLNQGNGNVEDVEVSAGGVVTNPDASGAYTLELMPGTYNIIASLAGYAAVTFDDVLVESEVITSNIDFTLEVAAVPENLVTEVVDFNDIHLSWNTPATTAIREVETKTLQVNGRISTSVADNSRSVLEGFNIYKDGALLTEIADPGTTSYDDMALDAGEYEYCITAVYDVGESSPCDVVVANIYLEVPTNVTAIASGADIVVSWIEPMENREFASYNVYRDSELIAESVTETSYQDVTVPTGSYSYNITALYDGGWESEFSDPATIDHTDAPDNLIPVATELTGNYPNPFNPVTNISFAIESAGNVSIEIFNIKGEKVKTLVNDHHEPGYYSKTWNGNTDNQKPASSGIYFYKMRAGGRYTSTRKMILLK